VYGEEGGGRRVCMARRVEVGGCVWGGGWR